MEDYNEKWRYYTLMGHAPVLAYVSNKRPNALYNATLVAKQSGRPVFLFNRNEISESVFIVPYPKDVCSGAYLNAAFYNDGGASIEVFHLSVEGMKYLLDTWEGSFMFKTDRKMLRMCIRMCENLNDDWRNCTPREEALALFRKAVDYKENKIERQRIKKRIAMLRERSQELEAIIDKNKKIISTDEQTICDLYDRLLNLSPTGEETE